MVRMYDFGAEYSSVDANERRAIAWPIAVWSCYIPESEMQDINILECLILQLIKNGYRNPKETLCNSVGFNTDLVDAALESCMDRGFFDKRFKNELVLTKEGNAVSGKMENPYEYDKDSSQNMKRIYMIQDLVTKSVVPVFDITKLPEFYYDDDNALEIHYDNYNGKKPKSASMRTALRYWAKLCNNRRCGFITGTDSIVLSEAPGEGEDIEDYIPFEDEVDWESVQEDGSVEEDIQTLADKESEEERKKKENEVEKLTILDDTPVIYKARGFIAININAPDEIRIISPFGERLNDWFRMVINRLRFSDDTFEEEIQFFLEEKREDLKNKIAFDNKLDIELLDKYPSIANDKQFSDLKRAIETFVRTMNRITSGSDETHNYTENRATALQITLRHVFDSNPEMLNPKIESFRDYKTAVNGLVYSYGLDEGIARELLINDNAVYNNMKNCREGSGHITGYCARFLMDAWYNKNDKSIRLIKEMPDFVELVFKITRPRNTSTHGNKGKNGKTGYAEMYVSPEEAIEGHRELERLIDILFSIFMEVKK